MEDAKSITMKQSYFDKLNRSSFVKNVSNDGKNGLIQSYQGIPVTIDNTIDEDYIVNK